MAHKSVDDLAGLTVCRAAALIASGALSSRDLVDALLARTEACEGRVRAWAHLDPDLVRRQAVQRDASKPLGPLHGVPIAVKDVLATFDQPTACNSPIYAGHRTGIDADCVARLRAAGAIIMGKTVTAEFAYRRPGPTRNPLDITRTPGGSSSGSAAAVAACMAPAALATQTGGSTIRPAAYCGIVGYKPTYGSILTRGLKHLAPSFDTIGIMARDIADVAAVSGVLRHGQLASPMAASGPPALIHFVTPYLHHAEPSAVSCLTRVARTASAQGAQVRNLAAPDWMGELDSAHGVIMAVEAAHVLAHEWTHQRAGLSHEMCELIAKGLALSPDDIAQARATIARARRWCAQHIRNGELVLTCAATGEAPRSESLGSAIFNRLWSALDAACLHVPMERGPERMPLGVQLVATSGDETSLLSAGRWLQERCADLPADMALNK